MRINGKSTRSCFYCSSSPEYDEEILLISFVKPENRSKFVRAGQVSDLGNIAAQMRFYRIKKPRVGIALTKIRKIYKILLPNYIGFLNNNVKIPVYLMPGMAASSLIFEHIHLPSNRFEVYRLEWIPPLKGEGLRDYAQRMSENIHHKNPVLVGVSFGGILIQEMEAFVKPRKLIVISSVKTRGELPRKMKFSSRTGVHKLLPTSLVNNVELLARYAFGKAVVKRLELYQKYLTISDKNYVDWAINEIVGWKRKTPIQGVVHIHGDKDTVFPIKYIKDCIRVKGGTHIMIINRFKWFNEHLPELIEN